MKRGSIILFMLFCAAQAARSQTYYRIVPLTTADGLSEGYVYAIHQDKKGFMWIGTHGGLNRYDGYAFKVFQYQPFNTHSLGDNSCFFIIEDSSTGKFWIGGSSSLNEFDPETYSNRRFQYTQRQLEFSDGIFVNRHQILLACEYDVILFDTETKSFSKVPVLDINDRPVAIARAENTGVDREGHFMVMSKTGVFFFDPMTGSCRRKIAGAPDFTRFSSDQIFNITQDSHGYYWIATNQKGLFRYDPRTNIFAGLPLPSPLKSERIRFDMVREDQTGHIWAGSNQGLFKINPQTLSLEYFTADKSKENFLVHPEINVIQEDQQQVLWVGTVGGGINKLIPQNTGFKNLVIAKDKGGVRTGTYFMALKEKSASIWFLNIWDELGKADLKTGNITMIGKPVLPAGYAWYSEGSLLEKDSQLIIINGENAYAINEKNGNPLSIQLLGSPGLSHIHQASNGHFYYMVKTDVSETIFRNDTIYGNEFFYDAVDDLTGNIWIGSSKGLIRFNTGSHQLMQFRHDEKDPNSISSDFIYALEIDNTGNNIWMAAYHGGLCSYDLKKKVFRHFDKEDGLADNIVYALEKDLHGDLWFTTNAGISNYNIQNNTFRNFGKTDGLLNEEFNRRSSTKDQRGWIYFGGITGIDYFHPDSIRKSNRNPELAFTGFRVLNHEYIPKQQDGPPYIELNPGDRYITVDFAALNLNDVQKIQYAYRIDQDTQWIKLGKQHSLSFANWQPGRHQINIRSTNVEGIWVGNEISCLVIIHPAWWQTGWIRLSAMLLILTIVALMIRGYFRRKLQKQVLLLEKEQAIEKERTRIATDMHDDLGAGLSRIKFLSDRMQIKNEAGQPDLKKISSYSTEMIEKMGEIVWALNQKNDTVADLIAFTRSYSAEYLQNHQIECLVYSPEEFPALYINGETRRNIFLSVKESLFNIVKHAHANKVVLRFSLDKALVISIYDNGKGIDQTQIRPYGNGLSNIRQRMQALGGSAEFISREGTEVILKIPLGKI